MLLIFLYIIVFAIYFSAPLVIRLLIMLINFFIPDHIPIIDEVIMMAGILSKLDFLSTAYATITDFAEEHPILFKSLIGVGILLLLNLLILL